MSKTIEQALSEIPDPEIRARALKNMNPKHKSVPISKSDYAISGAFVWDETPEKQDVWSDILKGHITTWQQACDKYPHLRELPLLSEDQSDPRITEYLHGIPVMGESGFMKLYDESQTPEFKAEQARKMDIVKAIELLESNGYRVEKESNY